MTEKREQATKYLLQLLKLYGNRAIVVKIKPEGPVCVMAKNFIKKQLSAAGILFPYNDAKRVETPPINNTLDQDKLSVLFHEALIEFEIAYVEDTCSDNNPKADGFVNRIYDWIDRKYEWLDCTFPNYADGEIEPFGVEVIEDPEMTNEEALAVMQEYGYDPVKNVIDLNMIFWDLAYKHLPLPKNLRQAIIGTATDPSIRKILLTNSKKFNTYIASNTDEEGSVIKDLRRELNEATAGQKKEFKRKLNEERKKVSAFKKVTKRMHKFLISPDSRIAQQFDLSKENDIREFLSWFEDMDRKVANPVVKRFAQRLDSPDLFIKMCTEHNEKYTNDEES